MSRLIDADRLSEAIYDNVPAPYEDASWAKENCLAEIEAAQTVDAVPVVRCRECDCSSMEGWYCNGCGIMPAHPTFPNEYCSKGRMTNNAFSD